MKRYKWSISYISKDLLPKLTNIILKEQTIKNPFLFINQLFSTNSKILKKLSKFNADLISHEYSLIDIDIYIYLYFIFLR